MNEPSVSVEEVAMLLGQKDVEIYALRKQLAALQKRIANLNQPNRVGAGEEPPQDPPA